MVNKLPSIYHKKFLDMIFSYKPPFGKEKMKLIFFLNIYNLKALFLQEINMHGHNGHDYTVQRDLEAFFYISNYITHLCYFTIS